MGSQPVAGCGSKILQIQTYLARNLQVQAEWMLKARAVEAEKLFRTEGRNLNQCKKSSQD